MAKRILQNVSPGPWTWSQEFDGGPGWVLDAGDNYLLEVVYEDEEGKLAPVEVQAHNLALAAAAPVLALALIEAREAIVTVAEEEDPAALIAGPPPQVLEEIDAALAAAGLELEGAVESGSPPERGPDVTVEVRGGVADVTSSRPGVTVEVIDHDSQESGE